MKNTPKANPIPGAVAAQMARGIPQHKALASVGLETKAPAPVKTPWTKGD